MNHKTVTEIKAKYKELISCLDKNGSNYIADVNKLVQDCKEELYARYDSLIVEIKEAGKDLTFAYNLQEETGLDTYCMQKESTFDSDICGEDSNQELRLILIGNE